MQADEFAAVVESCIRAAIAPLATELRASIGTLSGAVGELRTDTAAARDRVAALEARAPVPGPAGQDGARGADGLGFDDLTVEHDGGRVMSIAFIRGGERKTFPLTFPALLFKGAYAEGHQYEPGDVVQAGGSIWHCQTPTITRPGEHADAWRLMVRRGRDAKGKDGTT